MKEKLSKELIINLSKSKKEPKWMLDIRLKAYDKFLELDNPKFGPILDLDFDQICYYKRVNKEMTDNWNSVACNIKDTFETLGVIDAENKYLDGVTNQIESEVFYHKNNSKFDIIFTSTDDALKKYPDLFKKYFNNLVKFDEN